MREISLLLLSLAIALSMFAAPAFADSWKDESGKFKNWEWQMYQSGDDFEMMQGKHGQKFLKQMQKQQKKAAKSMFKDIQKHWAMNDIQRVQDLGFISGYPDGTFKPNSSLTSAEAVAIAIRLADRLYGDLDIEEDFDEMYDVPDWARGAVMKANALHMINLNRFHSHVQASRAQVAVMLAKALDLEPVDTDDIPFKDGILIDKEDLGYILALYKEGYVRGASNGKFNPNSGITRAEFAAILSRIADDLKENDPDKDDEDDGNTLTGTIDNLTNDEDNEDDWTIELKDGQEYDVDQDVKVYDVDGDEIDYWDLDEDNDEVVVLYLNDEDMVEEIYLAKTYEGTIEELDSDEITVDGDTFDLPSDFDIEEYLIGSEVNVYVHDDEVLKIDVVEDEDDIVVSGEVYDVDEEDLEIEIEQVNGNRFTFDVDGNVEIVDEENGRSWDFNDTKEGWDVELELEDGEVVEITVVDGAEEADVYEGIIDDLDEDEITVDGDTFDLVEDFNIEDYIIGSEVKIYVYDGEVEEIDVLEDEDDITVPGEVDAINGDRWYITIEQDSGNEFTFDVDEDVVVEDEADEDDLDFNDIDTGWEVELELDNGDVEKIVVTDR
ncbi:MAG: S-layer homology domain-containing protein [Firmicutes bacterium]|nr:S-layer homology domain-containing protein [Bacillota bacterium]